MYKQLRKVFDEELLKLDSFRRDLSRINGAKEVLQEFCLYFLSKDGFFGNVAFHGGTALRIVHRSERFSEDLDFSLIDKAKSFDLGHYSEALVTHLNSLGLNAESALAKRQDTAVKALVLKESSIAAGLTLATPLMPGQKLKIKLEVDTNPPPGAGVVGMERTLPDKHNVKVYDEGTLFAGKLNAMLTREYDKGRDWFDFCDFIERGVEPNLKFLRNALSQFERFDGKLPSVLTKTWVNGALEQRIDSLAMETLTEDAARFVRNLEVLDSWSKDFFKTKANKLLQRTLNHSIIF